MEESELIDNYLQGKLSEAEFGLVESKITNDKNFKRRLILRKAIIAGINEAYTDELKEKLAEFDRSIEGKKSVFKFSWKIAATLVGLIFVAAVIIRLSLSGQQLRKYDLTEIGIPNTMGSNSQLELAEAMNDFKNENYPIALTKFQSLLKSKPNNDTLLYFEGVSAYRTKEYSTAISSFTAIVDLRSFNYKEIAEYRLALSYLSNGKKQKAKELFLAISKNAKHKFQSNALMILNEQF
ncbi:MAG: hypothetical protein OJF59_001881 [Cytophagales bacterium]|jgi:TolA-binding protein|nr:MAG: hypothetical protein OJF59_001881 [Cytophagales bacterium]